MYFLWYRNILRLEMMIAYGMNMLGLYASIFVYYGCLCSRNIRENCSRLMVQILIPTDCLFLLDVTYCIFQENAQVRLHLQLLTYPLVIALMYLLWRYVHAVMPPKKAPVRIAEQSVRMYLIIGIVISAVFFIHLLAFPDQTDVWRQRLSRYEHMLLDVLVLLMLLAVCTQVILSRASAIQKLVTVGASLFLTVFLVSDFFENHSIWMVKTNVAYGMVVLLICSAVFPDRIRIQEVISRVLAMLALGNALLYGLFISVYYSGNQMEITRIESQELLKVSAQVLWLVTPGELEQKETLDAVRETLDHVIALTHHKVVFCETIDSAAEERTHVIMINQSREPDETGRKYPDADPGRILPDTILPEEKAALSGSSENANVILSSGEEPVAVFFYPWVGKNGEMPGVVGVCSFLERWMVDKAGVLYLQAVPLLFFMIVGALILSTVIDHMLIRSMNLTIGNIRRFFAGEGWLPDQDSGSQSSYEGYYFSRIMNFLIEELKDRDRKLISEIRERERIDADLDLAAAIQTSIMPNHFPPFPDHNEFSIYASMHPARQIGGDFYDFYLLDSDRLVLLVADVSGKGVPAALFMMTARSTLKSSMIKYQNPADALTDADKQLAENNMERMFVTVWIGVLELDSGRLISSNAGHERLLLYRDGAWEYSGEKPGSALGLFTPAESGEEQAPGYSNFEVSLKEGDMLFQCTDGVTECVSEEKTFFGRQRLVETLGQLSGAGPEALVDGMNRTLDQFRGNHHQFDDITVLSLRYNGAARKTDALLGEFKSVEEILEQKEWIGIASEHAAFSLVREKITQICPEMSEAKPCILVCDEIFHNIVQYAEAARVWFFCESRETELEIGFMDDGKLFDAASVMIREKEFADLSNGGMGITVIRTLTKNLRYERVGDCNLLLASVERKGAYSEQLHKIEF